MDQLLSIEELVGITGLSRQALAQMRHRGDGPRFVKFGRQVRYPARDLEDYVRQRTVERTGRVA